MKAGERALAKYWERQRDGGINVHNPIFSDGAHISTEARKKLKKFGHGETHEGKCMLVLRKVVDTGLKTAYEKKRR